MNKVILMGRLTRDPEVKYTQNDNPLAVGNYTIAVDRPRKKDAPAEADFINCVAFGKTAEFAEKYLRRGTKILIEGSIQTGSYENSEGKKVYTTKVLVAKHEFCESKASSADGAATPTPTARAEDDGFMNIPDGIDEELPFN